MVERYTQDQEYRFRISKDSFSRERYQTIKDAVNELVQIFPDRGLAFTLFGSLTKGKLLRTEDEAFRTDVDMLCYYKGESEMSEIELDNVRKIYPSYNLKSFEHFLSLFISYKLVGNTKCNYDVSKHIEINQ